MLCLRTSQLPEKMQQLGQTATCLYYVKWKVSHFSIEIFYIPELGFRSVTSFRPIYYVNWERKMSYCVSLLYQICKRVKHSIEFLVWCIISSWLLHANNVLTLISTLLLCSKCYEFAFASHVPYSREQKHVSISDTPCY